MNKEPSLGRFIGLVLVLLLPGFVLWMAIHPWVAGPAVVFCDLILTAWMPDVVAGVQLKDSSALVLTQYGELDGRIVAASVAGYQLGFPTDVRLLSSSLPFYAALHFATPQSNSLEKFGWGLMLLYPLVVLGVFCVCLKQLMVGLGVVFFNQSASWVPNGDIIAILYQLNTLIIPPLAPILVWVWQSRESTLLKHFSVLKSRT